MPVFRNYLELPRRVPPGFWRAARVVSVAVLPGALPDDVRRTEHRVVPVLRHRGSAAADSVLRGSRRVAEHLPAGRGQPDTAGLALQQIADPTGMVAQTRLSHRHGAVLRHRRCTIGAVQQQRPGHRGAVGRRHPRSASPAASPSRAKAVGAAASAHCCRCNGSTGRPRSSSSRTATVNRALRARRTATTSSHSRPIRRTCTIRIRTGAAPRKLFVGALPGFVLGFFTLLTATAGTPALTLYGRLGPVRGLLHRLVLRGGGPVDAVARTADGVVRRRRAEHLLLVRRADPGRLLPDRHRSGRALVALADQRRCRHLCRSSGSPAVTGRSTAT